MTQYLTSFSIATTDLVGLFIAVRFYSGLMTRKPISNRVKNIIFIGVLFGEIIINITTDNLNISLMVGTAAYFYIAYVFYHGKIYIKIIATVFLISFSLVSELIAAVGSTVFFGNVIPDIRNNTMLLLLGSVASQISLIIIIETIVHFRKGKASEISFKSWILIMSIPVISILLSVTSVYDPIIKNQFNNISAISCLSILYINMITFYLFDYIVKQLKENHQYKLREQLLLMQQEQYENIITGHNQVKKVRHDMLMHLIIIDAFLIEKEYDSASEYLRNLNNELDFNKIGIISDNLVVDALINNRKTRALEEGIEFKHEILIPQKLNINDMDICIVLGNILTNAIEACQRIINTQEKAISITMKYKRENLLIELKNAYNIDTIRIQDEQYISSKRYMKNNKFGIGLENVKTVIDDYGGAFQIKQLEDIFLTKIMIPDIYIKK